MPLFGPVTAASAQGVKVSVTAPTPKNWSVNGVSGPSAYLASRDDQGRPGCVVDEVSGAVFEHELTSDLPAAIQFLSPRLFMNNGATAAAVAFDCSGVYVETDF